MATSDYYIQDNSNIENTKLEAAKGLYQSGNYDGALKLYLDMVNTNFSYKLYYEIGRCYYKLNDLINAELYFTRSISLETHKNPSYVVLGNIYYKNGNIDKAIEKWTFAHSTKPDDEAICLNLATAYFTKNMRYQSIIYYKKYLKYAKDKTSQYYLDIKKSIEEFEKINTEFYQKAQRAISMKDNETAIQALEYAAKNYPNSFDTNYQLGKIYFDQGNYMKAMIYLKQAYCIDNRSLDVLERLSSALVNLGDYTSGYCCFKRMLPLVLSNQRGYLDIITTLKDLEGSFDKLSTSGHTEWAKRYYEENNYHFALFEYENCVILDGTLSFEYGDKIDQLKTLIKPEERIIKTCFEKGATYYSVKDYRTANKYFSKIMTLSTSDSADYRLARARMINV